MTVTNIILLALLVPLLLILSPNLRRFAATSICLWTWLLCLFFSGIVGELVGVTFGRNVLRGHFFDPGFLQNLMACYCIVASVAVLTFIVLYRFGAYSVFSLIEQNRKVQLAKPSVKLGAFLAVASPFAVDYIISAFKMSR
jgi:hypothetical protein